MLRASLVGLALLAVLGIVVAGCGEHARPARSSAATAVEENAEVGSRRYADSAPADAKYQIPAAAAPIAAPEAAAAGTVVAGLPAKTAADQPAHPEDGRGPGLGGDKYALVEENDFLSVQDAPLSTFSIDVDTASYAKTRAYLLEHHALPPPDAVRIEELINYFEYSYGGPTDEHPFAVHIESAQCPWQTSHRLVRFGIQGKRVERDRLSSNLVFLIDVSGSMDQPKKLPLVQRGLSLLVKQLGENDRVAIVVYAGAAGLVLPPTSGEEQAKILGAVNRLKAGGSTNGGQGIQLAYKLAEENFISSGVNRVLLCTDGDFNVGTTSASDLIRMAQEKAKTGVYLSVLGFGFGNHNDAMLEQLSDKANGNYAFIDSDREAHKVLVEQMQGTLVTIAKDVKLQVEFNPAEVAAYRLIGYENRRLADRDFNDDTKDAGEIGAGHSVTALYEIVPAGSESPWSKREVDPLKYQPRAVAEKRVGSDKGELLTLKLRYQPPAGGASTLLEFPVKDSGERFSTSSPDLQFAAAVASFGMLLRNSKFKGDASYAAVLETASSARGEDKQGLRSEFLELVKAARRLSGERIGAVRPAWQSDVGTVVFFPSRNTGWARLSDSFVLGLATGALVVCLLLCLLRIVSRVRVSIRYTSVKPVKFGPG